MTELATECGLALSSMTGVVDRLVEKGCVKRARWKKPSVQEIRNRVCEVLRLVGLEGFDDRPATQLSGGQQQRVAVASIYDDKRRPLYVGTANDLNSRLNSENG